MAETKKTTKTAAKTLAKTEAKAPAKKTVASKTTTKAPAKKTETKTAAKTPSKNKAPAKTKAPAKEPKVINPIEQLLNPENNENIVLFNDEDEAVEFEQIALIPYNKNLYCILKPVELTEGVETDEAVCFLISEEKDEIYLEPVDDDDTVDAIFDAYNKLFEEAKLAAAKTKKTK